MLHDEVIDGAALAAPVAQFGADGPAIVEHFVRHGLLGIAEALPDRHRHCCQRRFAFDEIHGSASASSIDKDFFFVDPAFKEWIRSRPDFKPPCRRRRIGLIDDLPPFESMPPRIRLRAANGREIIAVRQSRRFETSDRGADSDPPTLLFALLWACRERKRDTITLAAPVELLERLRHVDALRAAVSLARRGRDEVMAERVRDWAKKVDRDPLIRQLKARFGARRDTRDGRARPVRKRLAARPTFVSVSARSSIGARTEISILGLPMDELDGDDRRGKQRQAIGCCRGSTDSASAPCRFGTLTRRLRTRCSRRRPALAGFDARFDRRGAGCARPGADADRLRLRRLALDALAGALGDEVDSAAARRPLPLAAACRASRMELSATARAGTPGAP